jgi:hypothetical protein
MRLLFIALTSLSTGEVGVGIDVANQASAAGAHSYFIVEPAGQWLVDQAGYQNTVIDRSMNAGAQHVVASVVRDFRPDIIVLSDYFTYCAELELRFGVDPWFVENFGIPVVPIDAYELGKTDFRAELFDRSCIEVDKHILEMPVRLRPVPSTHPDTEPGGGDFPYRACLQNDRVTDAVRQEVLKSFGLSRDDRLLLLPISQWHHPLPEIAGDLRQRVTELLPGLIAQHLGRLPKSTHIVIVGNPLPGFDKLPAERTHVIPPCSPEIFSRLLGSSDVMLALGLPSQTLPRTIYADVGAFAMINSFTLANTADLDRLDAEIGGLSPAVRSWLSNVGTTVHPFMSWPWRLVSFTRALLADNPLSATMLCAEVFDEQGFVGGLEALLYDETTRVRQAEGRMSYAEAISKLPDAGQALTDIARHLAVSTGLENPRLDRQRSRPRGLRG